MSTEATDIDTDRPTTWALGYGEYLATVEKIEKINARAAKRGFTGRLEVVGTPREVTFQDEIGFMQTRTVYDTVISGEAPSYNGWRFLAAVDALNTESGDAFVIRMAPGTEAKMVDRDALEAGYCGHCKAVRGNRRYTYLVENTESGERVQVGSTCIKDFTGWQGKPVFIDESDVAKEMDDFLGGYGGERYSSVSTIVAVAWAAVQARGWVPASSYDHMPTKAVVVEYLYGTRKLAKEVREELRPYAEGSSAAAETIIAELLERMDANSEYGANLLTVLRAGEIGYRHIGIAASAVIAHTKMLERELKIERTKVERAAKPETRYGGEEGEKITVTGQITTCRFVPNDYDGSNLVVVSTDDGVQAKMFTNAAWSDEVKVGETITLVGTIKKLEEFNGEKQTQLVSPRIPKPPKAKVSKAKKAA